MAEDVKKIDLQMNRLVFLPPWLLLIAMVAVSLSSGDAFLAGLETAKA